MALKTNQEPTIIELILSKNPTLASHFEELQELARSGFNQQLLLFTNLESKIKLTEKLISELRRQIIEDPVNRWYGDYNSPKDKFDQNLARQKSIIKFQSKLQLEELEYRDVQNAIIEITEKDCEITDSELKTIINKIDVRSFEQDSLRLLAESDSPTKTMVYLLIHHHSKLKELHFLEEQLRELKLGVASMDLPEGNKEFTTARQVLAVYYLLSELDVHGKTDKTEIARFVQFLTGKEIKAAKITDTNIYKKIKKPLSKSDHQQVADLKFIKQYFEKLGLDNIVSVIDKDIQSYK